MFCCCFLPGGVSPSRGGSQGWWAWRGVEPTQRLLSPPYSPFQHSVHFFCTLMIQRISPPLIKDVSLEFNRNNLLRSFLFTREVLSFNRRLGLALCSSHPYCSALPLAPALSTDSEPGRLPDGQTWYGMWCPVGRWNPWGGMCHRQSLSCDPFSDFLYLTLSEDVGLECLTH